MYIFLSTVIMLIAVLLIFIVTIQNSKGGGLASGFASSNQIMGVRKTTDILEKLTWGLTATMVVLCILSTRFAPKTTVDSNASVIQQQVDKVTIPTPDYTQPFGNTVDQPANSTTTDSVNQ